MFIWNFPLYFQIQVPHLILIGDLGRDKRMLNGTIYLKWILLN